MRRNLKNLRLRAIAAVDHPCQEHAKALVIKRAPNTAEESLAGVADIVKYVCENDGAHSFQEVLADNKFDQNVWPCVDALSQSIRSIVGDASLTGGEREAKISASVEQFLSSVRDISPEVSKQLGELVRKREGDMPKTVEELEKQVGELTTSVNDLTSKLAESEKAKAKATADQMAAEDECKTAKAALEEATKAGGELATTKAELATTKAALIAATEETIKVGNVEVKKSEVGEAQFNLTKGLQDEAVLARLEKRAGDEFQHVVGTPAEKALILKSVDGKPEDDPVRKATMAVLVAAEKMSAAGFDRLGGLGGADPTEKAAQSTFKQKVNDIMKRDSCSENKAMSKARAEFPTEFAAAYPDSAPAERPAN